jgi:hypothetical protein
MLDSSKSEVLLAKKLMLIEEQKAIKEQRRNLDGRVKGNEDTKVNMEDK